MKTRFFALATLALALAACNNDNENLNGAPVAARFTADIAPATRAGGTTWDNGDRHRQRYPVRQRAFHTEEREI